MYRGCPTQKICCRFTGFSALNLCENGEWVESYEQALTPYDAGTCLLYTSDAADEA